MAASAEEISGRANSVGLEAAFIFTGTRACPYICPVPRLRCPITLYVNENPRHWVHGGDLVCRDG